MNPSKEKLRHATTEGSSEKEHLNSLCNVQSSFNCLQIHSPFRPNFPILSEILDSTMSSSPPFKSRPESKYTKAKRALRSLAVSVAIPLTLTIAVIFLFGRSSRHFPNRNRPIWVAPLWLLHLSSISSSFLIGLAAWLVWADGGFHCGSNALPLYIAHLSLSVVWNPLVLVIRARLLAFLFCVLDLVTLYACYRTFKRVNPFAKDLIKPCLAWTAYLCAVTYVFIDL
ncbi:translocator protein homolog [Cucurbita moschata]|uniref:Translocator protein homolog n=2 Tax=Cucurbita TaxID=3660 RepID=A0A6J1FZS9_CUCMO|nr:translocator protein homolog [Cucurbita moschata]